MPQVTQGPGKRPGVRLERAVRTLTSTPTTTLSSQTSISVGGAQQYRQGSQAPLPPEAADSTCLEPVVVVGRTSVGDSCYIPVTVEGVPCSALVDTGSTVTLVRPDVVPGLTQFEPTSVQLRTVTGELTPLKGKGMLTVSVGGWAVRHSVWVAAVQDACILGLDFLRATGCQLDLEGGKVSFQGGPVVAMAPFDTFPTPHVRLFAPAVSSAETTVNNPLSLPPNPVTPARCDLSPTPARTCPFSSISQPAPPLLPRTREEGGLTAVREIWKKNCDHLDSEQQEQLWQLLLEFQGSFAMSEEEVGRTPLVQHEIDTGDARPIKCRPRRLPLARQQVCDSAVENMLQADIIEPSDSPWAAAVVMVPKKNGDWRLCSDYRPVNGVTKKDSYPLPRIDESLDLVSGSTWFSSLDLRSGYYQVPLSPEARPKTAFCTGRGLWQFKVLSFGLCNAPATFARLMDKVLADIPRQQCLVYLDDILVHGSSFEAALGSLRQVLERIRAAGLKLHPEKCHFVQREVSFLGHKVGGKGIGTMEEKVRAVTDWPTPINQKQLKSFLGLASYYRRFVRGFSCTAAPLYQLLQKDRDFVWTEQCQGAFNSLQCALSEAPVLAPADPTLPFILDSDASGVGVGGVLSQVGPEGEKVVAYFNRAFNKAERRYCVTRRELLAVVLSIRHFKYYLCGLPFMVRTDHSALQWLMTFREPEGQVARWLEELQAYHFNVKHRAGAGHTNADALSRRPCAADGCSYCERRETRERELRAEEEDKCCAEGRHVKELICRGLQTVDVAEWRQQQEQDADLQPVLQWVETQQRPPWEEVAVFSMTQRDCGLSLGLCVCVRVCCSGPGRSQQRGRRGGRWWSPRAYGRGCLRPCMEQQGLGILESLRHSGDSVRASTGVSSGGMSRIFASAVTLAQPVRVPLVVLTLHSSSFQWGPPWKEWRWILWARCPSQTGVTGMSSLP